MLVFLALAGVLITGHSSADITLNEHCVVSILNRTVQVDAMGGWAMPNVPNNMGRTKARATCINNGVSVSGESDYFSVVANAAVEVGKIRFEQVEPLPTSLSFSDAATVTLATLGATHALAVFASYPDGSRRNVTAATSGINYISSNPEIASVDAGGVVTSKAAGSVIITARKDGIVAIKTINVDTQGDSDSDGMPNDFEKTYSLDPNNPDDAFEDGDGDGLSNLVEFGFGTHPAKVDSDGDGLSDGEEKRRGTQALDPDSDADGLNDGVEIQVGSDPLDAASADYRKALVKITTQPERIFITFNAVYGESAQQLTVLGNLVDGSTLDLTSRKRGTTYASNNLGVAGFGLQDGLIYAGQPGAAELTVASYGLTVKVPVTVEAFSPRALSTIEIPGFANSVDVSGDLAYVAAGRAGLVIVNVVDRRNPVILSSIDTPGTSIDVRVIGNLAYVADGESGLQVIDVSEPAKPRLLYRYATGGIAQDIVVDERYLYIADGDNGLEIADIAIPGKPVPVGHLGDLGNVVGVDVNGSRLAVVTDTTLSVVDVSDPINPVRRGSVNIGQIRDVAFDGRYAYVAASTTGWKVVDFGDSDRPRIRVGGATFYPTDVRLVDGLAFFAEVLAVDALAYVNITEPASAAFQGWIDLSAFGEFNGTGLAMDGSFAYTTESYAIGNRYESEGRSRLTIAQYRAIRDDSGVPPKVWLTSPVAGVSLTVGSKLNMSAVATDDVSVAGVDFLLNGRIVASDTTRPYQAAVSIADAFNSLTVSAKAVDLGGNVGLSTSLVFPVQPDSDGDGLGDTDEFNLYKTDPQAADTDSDSLSDGQEALVYKTDPRNVDTDKDGLRDGDEVAAQTNPLDPDTLPPSVSEILPATGSTEVIQNAPIRVLFSEPLLASSVEPDAIVVTRVGTGEAVPGHVTRSSGQRELVFVHPRLFANDSEYQVVVQNVRDQAGNLMANPFSSRFTTGHQIDQTSPQLVDLNPAYDSEMAVNSAITLQLSEPINPESVTEAGFLVWDTFLNLPVPGIRQVSADGQSISFVPDTAFAVGRSFRLTVSGVSDFSGNPLNDLESTFRTGFSSDTDPPRIEKLSFGEGERGVPTNAVVCARFTEMLLSTGLTGITLAPVTAGAAVDMTRWLGHDHRLACLSPVAPLAANTAYRLVIDRVADLAGNLLEAPLSVTFTTAEGPDTQAPRVISQTPFDGAVDVPLNAPIRVTLSEPVDPTSVGGSQILVDTTLSGSGRYPASHVSLSEDGRTLTLIPDEPLQSGHRYVAYLGDGEASGVWDFADNQAGSHTFTFTAGYDRATTPPTLIQRSLTDGASEIPVNTLPAFRFDRAMSDDCFTPDSLQLVADGIRLAGAATWSQDRRRLVFTPDQLLAPAHTYELRLAGLCDLAGNLLPAVTDHFTTSAEVTPDTTPPTATLIPAQGATVSAGSPLTLIFSEPIDPSTLAQKLTVQSSQENRPPIRGSLVLDGQVATFTPDYPLPVNARIYVSLADVTDLAGNPVAPLWSWFDTDTRAVDTTPPTIVSLSPAAGSVDVSPGSAEIVIHFSEPIDSESLRHGLDPQLYANGELTDLHFWTVSTDHRTVTFSASLPASALVTLMVGGVADMAGNRMALQLTSFTTGAAGQGRPRVVKTFPSSDLSAETPIVFYVSHALDASTVNPSSVHVSQDGVLAAGQISLPGDGRTIQFTPAQAWRPGSRVQVFLDDTIQDLSGDALYSYDIYFRVKTDPVAEAPSLQAVWPESGSRDVPINTLIDFQFSEPLDPATVDDSAIVLQDDVAATTVPVKLALIKGGRVLRMTPEAPLLPDTFYRTTLSDALHDLQGQPITNRPVTGKVFRTGSAKDELSPQVMGMSPGSGQTDVGIDARIFIRFSEAINPISLLPDDLSSSDGRSVISWDSDYRSVSYNPLPYPASSKVIEAVPAVQDTAGNLVIPFESHFTTGSGPDTEAPKLLTVTPSGSGVPVNAVVELRFSEAIDPHSVPGLWVVSKNLYCCGSSPVSGQATVSADGRTVWFVPDRPWAVGRQHEVYYGLLRDSSGNSVFGGGGHTFVTGFESDSEAPRLVQTSLQPGVTGVPLGPRVGVLFDEPIDRTHLGEVTLRRVADGQLMRMNNVGWSTPQYVNFRPSNLLEPDTDYVLEIGGVRDLAGNRMATVEKIAFRTASKAELSRTRVSRIGPLASSLPVGLWPGRPITVVDRNPVLWWTFDRLIDPLQLSDTVMSLWDETETSVPTTLRVAADGKTLTLTPKKPLAPGHSYRLRSRSWTGVEHIDGSGTLFETEHYFMTDTSDPGSPPLIAAQSVANGAVDVPLNPNLRFWFSESLSDACPSPVVVNLRKGDTLVAGHYERDPSGLHVRYIADAPLDGNTAYQLRVEGLCDFAGNTLAPATLGFTTGSVADSQLPIVKTWPAEGDVVPWNIPSVSIEFDEPVAPGSIRIGMSCSWDGGREHLAWMGTVLDGKVRVEGKRAILDLGRETLPPGRVCSVYGGAEDLAGNYGSSGAGFSTDPTAFLDTQGPSVVNMSPGSGAVDIAKTSPIVLHFSEPLNQSTVTQENIGIWANGRLIKPGSLVLSANNTVVTLTPYGADPLPAGSLVSVIVTPGVKDMSGNAASEFLATFATAKDRVVTRPSIVEIYPRATLSARLPIMLVSDQALSPATVNGTNLHVAQDGVPVAGQWRLADDGHAVVFTPDKDWYSSGALVKARYGDWYAGSVVQVFAESGVLDVDGNALNRYETQLLVPGDPALLLPVMTAATTNGYIPAAPLNISLGWAFSEAIDPASLTDASVSLREYPTTIDIPLKLELEHNNRILRASPLSPLKPLQAYEVVLRGKTLRDLQGNALAREYRGEFTTGSELDTTPPRLIGVNPAVGQSDVPTNVRVHFMVEGSVDQMIMPEEAALMGYQIGWGYPKQGRSGAVKTSVYLTPNQLYPAASLVRVELPIRDLAGNRVEAATHFTTGAGVDYGQPTVVEISPRVNQSDVPVNGVLSVSFNKPVDPLDFLWASDVWSQNIYGRLTGIASASPDRKSISFRPDSNWPMNASASGSLAIHSPLYLGDWPVSVSFSFKTKTDAAVDTTAPNVSSVSVGEGEQGVALNASFTIAFDEAVNSTTLEGAVIMSEDGGPVPVQRVLSANGLMLTVSSKNLLSPGQRYRMTVSGVTDLAGNIMPLPVTRSFTTGEGAVVP